MAPVLGVSTLHWQSQERQNRASGSGANTRPLAMEQSGRFSLDGGFLPGCSSLLAGWWCRAEGLGLRPSDPSFERADLAAIGLGAKPPDQLGAQSAFCLYESGCPSFVKVTTSSREQGCRLVDVAGSTLYRHRSAAGLLAALLFRFTSGRRP
jgi:hypothetical protein